MLTWEAVVSAEPRLARIMERIGALAVQPAPAARAEDVFESFKSAVVSLVGWERDQRRGGADWLFDSAAYDIACAKVRDELKRAPEEQARPKPAPPAEVVPPAAPARQRVGAPKEEPSKAPKLKAPQKPKAVAKNES